MPSERPATRRLDPLRIGEWLVEPALCRMSRQGSVIRLRPQLMDLLVCLAWRAGRVVPRDVIFAEVWPGQFVAESGLGRCVAELRRALEDDPHEPRFIETIPKRGYRLVAEVVLLETDGYEAAGPLRTAEEPPAQESASVAGAAPPAGEPRAELPGPTQGPAGPSRAARRRRYWIASVAVGLGLAGALLVFAIRPGTTALSPTDTVVLCFENRAGEPVFDGTLQLAMEVQLEQSPFLKVLSQERIWDTLRLMGRGPGSPVTRAVSREVCAREGARAVIAGSIAAFDRGYLLGIEAIACETGEALAREQARADGHKAVLETLGSMTSKVRRKLGESLASVARHDVPVTRATTGSLEALRAASLGDLERRRGRGEAAVGQYRRAVALDPSFALAHSRLGSALGPLGFAREMREAVTRAHALRERTSLPERLEIEARFHMSVEGDFAGTIGALESLRQTHPRSALAHRGLSQSYALVGRYDEALAAAREALRLEPAGSQEHVQLALAYLHLNRFDEARKVGEEAIARKVDGPDIHSILFDCAFGKGDRAAMSRELAWAATNPGARMLFLLFEAEASVYAGKLRAARAALQAAEALARERGDDESAAEFRLAEAEYEALYGSPREARRLAEEVLKEQHSSPPLLRAAVALAFAGETGRVLEIVEQVGRMSDRPRGDFWQSIRATALAAAESRRGRPDRALELLNPLFPIELGAAYEFTPPVVRGQAHLAAGRPAEAIEAFGRVLSHNGLDPSSALLPIARLGIARAHALAGNVGQALAAYDGLLALWSDADPGLPLLLTVRGERARLARQGR